MRFVHVCIACISLSLGMLFAAEPAPKGGTLRGEITGLTATGPVPLEDVSVKIVAQDGRKAEWTTLTDADGSYKQTGLPAGRYLINIAKAGYTERTGLPVTIVEGGDSFVPLKMPQKGHRLFKPLIEGAPNKEIVTPRIASLLHRVTETVSQRYDLDTSTVKALEQAVLDSIAGILKGSLRPLEMLKFTRALMEGGNMAVLETLVTTPACRPAFTEFMGDIHFQDYLESIKARRHRYHTATAQWITALLDTALSLSTDQREKVMQLLLDTTETVPLPVLMNPLMIRSHEAAQLATTRLKVPIEGILSEAQSKVWQELLKVSNVKEVIFFEKDNARVILREGPGNPRKDKKHVILHEGPGVPVAIEGNINGKDIEWIGIEPRPDEAQQQRLAEATLTAHTELLGTLDAHATHRLALVTKGVVQQYLETQDENETSFSGDITDHPLYKQTLKDVLSETAFAQYIEYQAERTAWHRDALLDMSVAALDGYLLLDDTQREQVKTALLPVAPFFRRKPALQFFLTLGQTVDLGDILTPWQQREFESLLGPLAQWKK